MKVALAVAVVVLLAGCSSPGKASGDKAPGLEGRAQGIDVQATATTGVIRGVVVDAAIRPVVNATVSVVNAARNATTNAQGAFGFEGLEPGNYFLAISHPRFNSVQASATVEAGVSDPQLVRVQLEAIPFSEPSFEVLHQQVFLDASVCAGTCLSCCDFLFNADTATTYEGLFFSAANGTRFIEVLTAWKPTSSTADGAMLYAWVYNADGQVSFQSTTGPPNVAQDFRDDKDLLKAQGPLEVRGSIWARTDTGVGLAVQQSYDVYAVATVNFAPPEGYRFDVDGPPTLPT